MHVVARQEHGHKVFNRVRLFAADDFTGQIRLRGLKPDTLYNYRVADESLLPLGLRAFFDYTPDAKLNHAPDRLYRNIRWSKHLELFFLDNR